MTAAVRFSPELTRAGTVRMTAGRARPDLRGRPPLIAGLVGLVACPRFPQGETDARAERRRGASSPGD